jgi:hypothetical protein
MKMFSIMKNMFFQLHQLWIINIDYNPSSGDEDFWIKKIIKALEAESIHNPEVHGAINNFCCKVDHLAKSTPKGTIAKPKTDPLPYAPFFLWSCWGIFNQYWHRRGGRLTIHKG